MARAQYLAVSVKVYRRCKAQTLACVDISVSSEIISELV